MFIKQTRVLFLLVLFLSSLFIMNKSDLLLASGILYVSSSGSDNSNSCLSPSAPCKTIKYTLNQAENGDTIQLDSSVFQEAKIIVDLDITILGDGPESTIIEGGSQSSNEGRIFFVSENTKVEFRDLTIQNGFLRTGNGGGILNQGEIVVVNVSFENNVGGTYGGAIFNNGTANIVDSAFFNNESILQGGAIFTEASSTITISNSTFSENKVESRGGALSSSEDASVVINNSIFQNNESVFTGGAIHNAAYANTQIYNSTFRSHSDTSRGGAIYNAEFSTLLVEKSTFLDNQADIGGGAIYNFDAVATITNSTFSRNRADLRGSAIENSTGTVSLNFVTVYDNLTTRDIGGGAVYNSSSENFSIMNSIIANNFQNATPKDCTGSFNSYGYNLIEDDFGCILNDIENSDTNIINQNANVEPIGNNGGATQTIALKENSSAIDAGVCFDIEGNKIEEDQRGFSRPGGANCDIGAFEVTSAPTDDKDNDGMPDIWEQTYGFDPDDPSDAIKDEDEDDLLNVEEFNSGTIPTDFDTDDDLLPDGFEVKGNLDPLSLTDLDGDPDTDNLGNFDEHVYGTNPNDSDSDNDNTNDGTEVNQCSDPNSSSDNGQAPPEGEVARIRLTVGDHSGSHSERYNLIVGPITHQAPEFGVVAERDYCFKVGQTYKVKIVHKGSCPNQCYHDLPDYDYTARIREVDTPAGITIDDPDRILGVHAESDYFYAQGKSAELTINSPTSPSPPDDVNVSIELRAFIPCEAITISFGFGAATAIFAGDGYSMSTFRALEQINIDVPSGEHSTPSRIWGESKRYRGNQVEYVPNAPSWCLRFLEGEERNVWYRDTLPVTESNMRVTVYKYPLTDNEVFTNFYIDGGNPAAPEIPDFLIPNLNANIRVDTRVNNGEIQYKLRGAHDGFPAYYLYINGKTVHCYDPLLEGGSPWYLGGGLDVRLNKFQTWNNLSDSEDCTRPLGLRLNYPEVGPGNSVTLTGTSFNPQENLSVYANDSFIGSVVTDNMGRFKVKLTTNLADEGIYNISVRDSSNVTLNSFHSTDVLAETQLIISKNYPDYEDDIGLSTLSIPAGIAQPWEIFLPMTRK